MCEDKVTSLDVRGLDYLVPTKWADWIKLPIGEDDFAIHTTRGPIRVPTVIVLSSYDKVPVKRPKYSPRAIWERDQGTCQYTGKKLKPGEGNIDHVIPASRGGATSFTNCVLSHSSINSKKANKTPKEAKLQLLRKPAEPKPRLVTDSIPVLHPTWGLFLKQN